MPHYVTSEDSDYFIGYCECDQLPCLSCVAAQEKLFRDERIRGALVGVYYKHHRKWPQSVFIDDIIKTFKENP